MSPMIVVYGTVCRDRVHVVPGFPDPGGYIEIEHEIETVGGEAVNTVLALRSWGVQGHLAGNPVGPGGLAGMLVEAGLSTEHLPTDDGPEPVCDIYVTPDGQRTMFGRGFRDLAARSDPDQVPLVPGGWLTVDSNLGAASLRAAALARSAGMRVYLEDIVEPGPNPADFWQTSTDWVARKGDIQANVKWLDGWLDAHGGFGILSDGANGFVAGGTTPDGLCRPVRHYPPFPCPKLVDSTGAGDVFRAGMLFGLDSGWPLADCLRYASAAGSLNCASLGANSAIPTEAKVRALVAIHPEIAVNYE